MFFVTTAIGCSKRDINATEGPEAQGSTGEDGRLVLFNYEEYIGSKTIKNFKRETGIEVEEVFFSDEEEAVGAIQSDPDLYDLVVTSGDSVRELIRAKTITHLDHDSIPNLRHISEEFRNNSFDPGMEYSIPYLWGTTGVVINTNYIKEDTQSWQVLFDDRYAGHIGMIFNPFEVIASAGKLLGYSINTRVPEEFEEIRNLLLRQKSLVHGYYDDVEMQELMESEELWVAQLYSGEGLLLMDRDEKYRFFVPQEGAALWVDCFVIPRDAKHKEAAHRFLDYILKPEVNAEIASELWYSTPNESAIPIMDSEVVNSPMVFPPEEVLQRCEYFHIVGELNTWAHMLWSDLIVGN
jgi:spermidine/putrescine transport system substrate-binding protein